MRNIQTFIRMYQQLNEILNNKQKRDMLRVAIVAAFSALLETLGVSIILPFVLAMLQPETLMDNSYLMPVFSFLGINKTNELLFFTAAGIIFIYAVKNAVILYFNYIQLKFRNELERDLSVLMMQSYVHKPYSFFLDVNSAQIMQGISGDMAGVATVVDNYCSLFNEGLTTILIGILLIVINPLIAISFILLAGVTALFMVVILRKRIGDCGAQSREAFTKRYKSAYQTINGIKEINVMKRQENFLNDFKKAAGVASDSNTEYLWIAKLPSRIIEVIFITGLIFMVMLSYNSISDMTILIAQFGSMAVASIRILPSISNIANAMNSLVFNRLALENAYNNIIKLDVSSDFSNPMDVKNIEQGEHNSFTDKIYINNIYWKYQDSLPFVLHGLSLEIKPGEAIGLIGESGAGKTTLADIVLGLFIPQQGTVSVDGKSIYDIDTMWHKMIGYVPQSVFLLDDSIKNNILFGIEEEEESDDKIWDVLEQVQLKEFVLNLTDGLDTVLGERGVKISGGQRQRIAIARALYYNPDILVLDEATSALDNETENAVIEAINALQGEKTLIIVAHRLSTIANCDKIYEICNGRAIMRNKNEVLA